MTARTKTILYWTTTTLIASSMLSGGIAELAHRPETIDGMKELGYPVYFIMIIGCWKILGTAAIVAPRLPRLKEWAYAGIVFNMTGATVSHAVRCSAPWHIGVTLSLAAIALASGALRPAGRRLAGTAARAGHGRRWTATERSRRGG